MTLRRISVVGGIPTKSLFQLFWGFDDRDGQPPAPPASSKMTAGAQLHFI